MGVRGPARMPLTPRQAQVLTAAADGAPLSAVAARCGITREQAAARLSEAYRRLGVSRLPREERRAAAVDEARRRGLLAIDGTKPGTKNGCTAPLARQGPANDARHHHAPAGAPDPSPYPLETP